MVSLNETKVGDSFLVSEINASPNSLIFLSALGVKPGAEIYVRSQGFFPGTLIVEINDNAIQLDTISISQIKGEIIKVKKLVR